MRKFTPIASILVVLGSGSALFGGLPAAQAMAFQCFDRSSGEQVAESHIDITTPDVRCVPTGGGVEPFPSSPIDPFAAKRALNLARGIAIALNGGFSQYRPSSCMLQAAMRNTCITQSNT